MNLPDPQSQAAFMAEWEAAATAVQDTLQTIFVELGCGEDIRRYVSGLRIYPRIPYLCASWVADPGHRKEIGIAFAIHATGLKLLDDLVDGDSGLRASELVVGQIFCQVAIERYFAASNGKLLAVNTMGEWLPMYRHVITEQEATFVDLDHWIAGCRIKSLLYLYIESLYRADLPRTCDDLREAFILLTTLGQVVDDWNDRTNEHETSNIILMAADGRINRASAIEYVEIVHRKLQAILAAHPPQLNFHPFVEGLADRARRAINSA